jgi:hypothetical protein
LGLSCDSGLGHAALGLRLSLRLAPTNAHPPRRRHRCLRSRGHRVVGLRLLLRGGVLRGRRARGYRAVLVPLLHRRRLAVLLLLLGLRVLLLVLRRHLRVLRLRLLVLLLRRRLLLVLPILLLRRRLLVLLLRRRLLRRRGGRPSRFVHVLPLLGVVVLRHRGGLRHHVPFERPLGGELDEPRAHDALGVLLGSGRIGEAGRSSGQS